jgi:hypothetical protein
MPLYAGISDPCEICGQMIVRKFGCKRNCEKPLGTKIRRLETILGPYFLSQRGSSLWLTYFLRVPFLHNHKDLTRKNAILSYL